MKAFSVFACAAVFFAAYGSSTSTAQVIDPFDDGVDLLMDDEGDRPRVAQRPRPPREPDDVLIPRDRDRARDSRDRASRDRDSQDRGNQDRRDRPDPSPAREVRSLPPGPARLEARLEAVERKLDRILQELRRIEGEGRENRDGGPRPRMERLPADRFGRPPMMRDPLDRRSMREPSERRPEGPRPHVERFPPRSPDAPRRDILPPARRPDVPSEDRLERRPGRSPLPLARPRPLREREWDRPDGD